MAVLPISIGASDAVSVNVTISSQNILNGSSINMTAAFDVGSNTLNNIRCGYTSPGGSALTSLTTYNIILKVFQIDSSLDSADRARLNLTSSGNPMLLNISPITFEDEKRTFYCVLQYYDGVGTLHTLNSQKTTLEHVYCTYLTRAYLGGGGGSRFVEFALLILINCQYLFDRFERMF